MLTTTTVNYYCNVRLI